MKAGIFYTAAIVGTLLAAPALAQDMTVTLTDPVWNGKKVPASQVCERFGGKGAVSPSMLVSNLPDGVVAIDVWFSDDNNERMNWGGHGKVKYIVPAGSTSFELKSFPAESDDLPDGVISVRDHKGAQWSGTNGAYLPPCSGGRGHVYSAYILARDADDDRVGPRLNVKFGSF